MHVQIVTFRLDGLSEADYHRLCDELAPAFADVPGLLSKVWLADPARNAYGGIYAWRDRQALLDYQTSALFRAVLADRRLADVTSRDFAVLDRPTRVTHGLAATAV
jgi:quinol monooxygenase YgiN